MMAPYLAITTNEAAALFNKVLLYFIRNHFCPRQKPPSFDVFSPNQRSAKTSMFRTMFDETRDLFLDMTRVFTEAFSGDVVGIGKR